jgi:uncharacterized membrane protein HdeD (DUF308 family)
MQARMQDPVSNPVTPQMQTHFSRNWWILALRGVIAIVFGLLVLFQPGISLQALLALFSAYLLIDGISNMIHALRNHDRYTRWWVLLLEGLVSVIAGILTFVYPAMTALVLLYVIASWAIITGILEIAAAIRLRQELQHEWLLALSGVLSLVFGVLLMIAPGTGILTLLWLIGSYAIVFGVVMLILGLRMRSGSAETVPRPI